MTPSDKFFLHKNTELVLGPPGTGKTTTLLSRVRKLLGEGVAPQRIAYVSFTRAAANEARDRAMEQFTDLLDTDFIGFKTLHAMAYRHLGVNNNLMFNRKHAAQFGKRVGYYIGGISVQNDGEDIGVHGKGTQFMFTNNYARCCEISMEEGWRRTVDMGAYTSWTEQAWFNQQYEEYRREHSVYDFTELLEEFSKRTHECNYDWVIVDEAQDLMALQWRVVQGLCGNAAGVIVAGDDDQAIYQWSGAAVDIFLNLEHSRRNVLAHSYRLPPAVFDLANRVSGRITNRYAKDWRPRAGRGKVTDAWRIEDVPLQEGEWLILVRNNALIKGVCEYLRSQGFNYWSKNDAPFDKDLVRDIRVWEYLRTGGSCSLNQARRVLARMRVGVGYKRGSKELPKIPPGQKVTMELLHKNGVKTKEPWYDAFSAEDPEQVEYMRHVLRSGEKLSKPRIIVSTIHSTKGGEADNVLLYTDMSARTARMAELRADEEARVFYVGVTRAKTNLYIIRGPYANHYNLS